MQITLRTPYVLLLESPIAMAAALQANYKGSQACAAEYGPAQNEAELRSWFYDYADEMAGDYNYTGDAGPDDNTGGPKIDHLTDAEWCEGIGKLIRADGPACVSFALRDGTTIVCGIARVEITE